MLCRTEQDVLAQSWSHDEGKTWSALEATTLPNPNSGVDAVTLRDGRNVLVYNPTKHADPIKGRTPLVLAVSGDGVHWTDVLTLENDYKGQYSYPAVIQSRDGLIHITYTWQRKNIRHAVVDPTSF
jgi:predicted neuraminidase